MKVKIISDSTCDLPQEIIDRYGIVITPLTVTLGDNSYKDGTEMDVSQIYDFVDATGELPKSSAVNVAEYLDVFDYWNKEGYAIVHINISSELSCSHQNALIAAGSFSNVYVVDSKSLSTGQGLMVMHAAEMAAEGKTADEIFHSCIDMAEKIDTSFIIDSLEYLYKGGRCSALSMFGANLLKLKPCIIMKEGKLFPDKKYRGSFKSVSKSYIQDKMMGRDDIDLCRVVLVHTKCTDECLENAYNTVKELAGEGCEILVTTAGSTITTHCGPNTLGVMLIKK